MRRSIPALSSCRSFWRRELDSTPGREQQVTLIALAIRFDQRIREGVVGDQAEIARLGLVTRARVAQIMNLLNLAPEIQAAILDMAPVTRGWDIKTERDVRSLMSLTDWNDQARRWGADGDRRHRA
jgi:hypothetical protein